MNFSRNKIINDPFYIYEKASPSRKATDFNVFTRCSYRIWISLDEATKMTFIRSSLLSVLINMLVQGDVLPPGFDKEKDDPFLIAPFTSDDFKSHLRKVISHCWKNMPETLRDAWNTRAQMLNQRPVVGQFETIPESLVSNNRSAESILQRIIQQDYLTTRAKIDKCFRKTKNCKTTYNKVEHVYMDIKLYNKFYFNDSIPFSIFNALFGDLSIFTEEEKVSKKANNKTATYHVMSHDRIQGILSFQDVDFSQFHSYNNDEEVIHHMCSYGFIQRIGESGEIKFYGWTVSEENKLVVRFNNYDNTTNLEAKFDVPKLETYLHGVNNAGNNIFKHNYKFTQDDISQCKNYVMKSFCPIIVQLNMAKVSMKLIASRASISFNEKVFNTHYSS